MNLQKRPSLLEQVTCFCQLTGDELAEVARHVRIRHYSAHQSVVEYQDDSHDVFFIIGGRLKVTLFSEAGREVAFRELTEGQSFGELSAIDGQPRSASVIALTDAVVGSMTAADFVSTLRRYPDVAMAVLRSLTHLVRSLSERVHDFSEKVEVRVCHELLRLAKDNMVDGRTARIRPAPKQQALAARVNTHREAVSRLLSKLARRGIAQRGRGELLIKDVAALHAYAQQLQQN